MGVCLCVFSYRQQKLERHVGNQQFVLDDRLPYESSRPDNLDSVHMLLQSISIAINQVTANSIIEFLPFKSAAGSISTQGILGSSAEGAAHVLCVTALIQSV